MEDAFGDSAMGATFESFATPLDGDGTTADADITDEGQSDISRTSGTSRDVGGCPGDVAMGLRCSGHLSTVGFSGCKL